jgi:Domain of unknown function (DUF222)/HNH endonuclease
MAAVLTTAREPFRPTIWPDSAPELQAVERLEAEITELWGHINAATYRFLNLLAEFDRRKGWELHGLANCAQWLNWQCGIGDVAAREKVRAARALEALPKISDAFGRGVISYSKVRAITRIATAENEADLLNVAVCGTAAHVERLVGKYRRVERLEEGAQASTLHRHRSLHFWYEQDGSLVIHAKLPPEVGAVVKKAIEEAMSVIEKESAPAVETESNVSAETFEAESVARGAASAGSGVAAEPPRDVLSAKRADALRLLADSFLTRRSDAYGSAADRFQVVVHVDQRLLAVANVTADTKRGSETERVVGASFARDGRGDAGCDTRCELEDGRALALETVRRLACDTSVVGIVDGPEGEPLNVGRKTRSIPPALQRALKARDGGCRFPGCTHSRFTEGHHVKHWADGGETKLDNLIMLCRFHHRLIHEGGFGLHALDDGAERNRFVFTRPDGTRVEPNGRQCFRGNKTARASDQPLGGPGDRDAPVHLALLAQNRERGLTIDWRTSRCQWLGEGMDYGLAVEALIQRRDRTLSGALQASSSNECA